MEIDAFDNDLAVSVWIDDLSQNEQAAAVDLEVAKIFQNHKKNIMLVIDWNAEAGIDLKWGDPDGVEYYFKADAQIKDDKGNFGKMEAQQKSDGAGNLSLSAGHDSKGNKK